jgi:hypothetical protein
MSKYILGSILSVFPINPLIDFTPSPLTIFLATIHFFQHDLHVGFWETFMPKLLGLPINPFSVLVGFSFHFLWGDQLHFDKVRYANGLFGG